MIYDFTSIMDRRGRDALAVDSIGADVSWAQAPTAPKEGFTPIPMWVADMNFPTVPTIPEAIRERISHPAFGYFIPTDQYYDSIMDWQKRRNGVEGLTPRDIGYENGVLGCVSSAVQAFTSPGDKILLHSPTYIGFSHVLEDTGRMAELSPLLKDGQGVWRMDYDDMDARIKRNHIHLAVFCSPHNPCGRVWEKEEIEKAMEVFRENQCIVISDEIWSDILLNGHHHIPTQSVSRDARDRTIAVYAPSKTFNLAGLIGSYHIIYDAYLRDRIRRQSSLTNYNGMNVLSMHALIGAYKEEGHEWVDQLCQVLSENVNYAYDVICRHFPGIELSKPEGTYMLFLHCEEYCLQQGLTIDQLIQKGWDVGVAWQQGAPFHDPWGIRMNLALPRSLVEEAMERLQRYVFITSGRAKKDPFSQDPSSMTPEECRRMMIAVCDRIIREKPCLTRLDSPIGDADHGIGMSRGMGAARTKLLEMENCQDICRIFKTLGRTMISTMGGSSGVIFGTMFAGAAEGMETAASLTTDLFVKMMRQGLTEVQKRGKAVPGNKTMVDALAPAVEKMEEAMAGNGIGIGKDDKEDAGLEKPDLPGLFRIAAEAAKAGAEATRNMIARHGHSKTLGKRALGHPDPGAVSVYFIFDAMREEAEKTAK